MALQIRTYDTLSQQLLAAAFLLVLARIAVTDLYRRKIPNRLVLAVLLLALAACRTEPDVTVGERLAGLFAVSGPMLGICILRPGAFGAGDVKLTAAAGLLLGWQRCLTAAVLAVMTAGIYALFLLLGKKADRGSRFAFGPFLCLGMAAVLFIKEPAAGWTMFAQGWS